MEALQRRDGEASGWALADQIAQRPADPQARAQWHGRMIGLCEIAEAILQRPSLQGRPPEVVAAALVAAIAAQLGGERMWLPGPESIKRALRDREIWYHFDGRNAQDLARRYRMPITTLYDVLRRQRRLAQQWRRAQVEAHKRSSS